MEKKSILSRIGNIYNNLEEYLLVVSLVINVLLVFLQVIMRTVFKNSLTWSEELSRYIFIWQIWLGASIALKYNEHIRVTLIYSFLKNKKVQAAIGLLADLIWFLFCAYMVVKTCWCRWRQEEPFPRDSGYRLYTCIPCSLWPHFLCVSECWGYWEKT